MRPERTVQASIFDLFAKHEIGRELKAMSAWLDDHRELLGLVAADLCRHGVQATGRHGLPAEAVLRCALLEQHRQRSYQELAFHLEDSASFQAFARLPWAWSPKKSVLQRTIGAIRAEIWEAINRTLLAGAAEAKLERGTVVRLDSTVTAALVHEPILGLDPRPGSLLWDAVRVMTRLLRQAQALGAGLVWRDHRRAAKRRARDIEDMVRSRWVYRRLANFRAGIEAGISCLKRAWGLARCTWRGLDHFRAYVWSAVVAYNLALLARLAPA